MIQYPKIEKEKKKKKRKKKSAIVSFKQYDYNELQKTSLNITMYNFNTKTYHCKIILLI